MPPDVWPSYVAPPFPSKPRRFKLKARMYNFKMKIRPFSLRGWAVTLLAGLGFTEEDQSRSTKSFSGGWRMRLALARALFVKVPTLLPRIDGYRCGAIATDIIHRHSGRLDYYKGIREADGNTCRDLLTGGSMTLVSSAGSEENQVVGEVINSYLWIYSKKDIIKNVDIDVGLDSRIVIVLGIRHGAYGSCSIKLLTDELKPSNGNLNRNDRLRLYLLRRGYFSQHHVDTLNAAMSPVQFLASRFPGKTEHEYRGHLCNFQISGMTGLQLIGTLSGGQKSRVPLAALSLMNPHVLLLDEPINHLDIEGLDPLMAALNAWNRGAVIISHDERFTTTVAKELWVCADGTVSKFKGDVQWGDTFSL
ncbi:ABC transporter [Melanogaster broomeanus]|nr:ABC transporter [Melanogaster broomeanus]